MFLLVLMYEKTPAKKSLGFGLFIVNLVLNQVISQLIFDHHLVAAAFVAFAVASFAFAFLLQL
jgi:tryptophan-rich sensory protein